VKLFHRLVASAGVGGASAAAIAAVLPIPHAIAFPRFTFPPDLLALLGAGDSAATFVALAAISAAMMAVVFGVREPKPNFASVGLALINPLFLYAWSIGAGVTLASAAILLHALLAHVIERDHASTVRLGIAAALAPLVCNSTLAFFPVILVIAPLLSPWAGGRRIVGFAVAIFAPAAMAFLAILYLYWLMGAPQAAPGDFSDLGEEVVLVLAGAAVVAAAGYARSLMGATGAFAVGAAILALAQPELVARLAAPVR
jgi:hypothetical protein